MDEPKERNTLYGGKSSNTCAFCAYHGKALTPKQMQKHQCLGKGCTALIRHEHPYWREREEAKKVRRARKARLEQKYLEVTGGGAHAVCTAQASADSGGFPGRT